MTSNQTNPDFSSNMNMTSPPTQMIPNGAAVHGQPVSKLSSKYLTKLNRIFLADTLGIYQGDAKLENLSVRATGETNK